MRQETSNRAILTRGLGVLAAVAGAFALIAAGPARANNEFENGFEDQLGRIAAHGAVSLGLHVLTGGAYYGPPAVAYYPPSYAYGYARPYPVRHVVRHKVVHKHGWNCGHRGYGRAYGHNRGHGYDRWDDDDGGRRHGHDRWDDDD